MTLVALFFGFNFIPLFQNAGRIMDFILTEDMRMTADQLAVESSHHVIEIKVSCFSGKLRMKNYLEKKVSEFLSQAVEIFGLDTFDDFFGFVAQALYDRLMSLIAIPRASAR
jgi:hypothetical protein